MKSFSLQKYIYIMMLSIAFTACTVKNFLISSKGGFVIVLMLIIWAFLKYMLNSFKIKDEKRLNILSVYLKNNLGIKLAIHGYTIILVILGLTEARFLSTNLITYINAVSAVAVIYLLGKEAWEISIISIVIAWIISILWQIFTYGSMFYKHLEFNDLAFATGYLVLYYIIFLDKWKKKDIVYSIIAVAVIIIAAKRIGIGSIIVTLAIHYIYKRMINVKNIGKKYMSIVSVVMFLFFYFFVYSIINENIFYFVSKYTDNIGNFLMGRNYYWKVLGEICDFKFSFLGYGRNASETLFTNEYAYMRVNNVHSDILKNYMECGFVLFGIWLYTYLFRFRNQIGKKIGYKNAYIFFVMTIYTFIIYITDNTETYLISQFMYMLVPMICAYKEER